MNGDARALHAGGVPSMFGGGFGGVSGGARVIATRTTTTHQVATGGGAASAAMHFDQLKNLALSMGMAASAGAVQKSKADEKAAEAAAKIAELEKALGDARREVTKLQESNAHLKKTQDEQAAKQTHLATQIDLLSKTLRDNNGKLKKVEAKTEKLSRELNHADSVMSKQASTSALQAKKSKKDLDAAREHSAELTSNLQAKQEELERASAKLADAEAKAKEQEKAAAAALQEALDAAHAKTAAAEAAAAMAHGEALAAAQTERGEALKKAAELELDASITSSNLQRLEKERDDALKDIDKLAEERETLVAAAERASGLQLALDDLNNALAAKTTFAERLQAERYEAVAARKVAEAAAEEPASAMAQAQEALAAKEAERAAAASLAEEAQAACEQARADAAAAKEAHDKKAAELKESKVKLEKAAKESSAAVKAREAAAKAEAKAVYERLLEEQRAEWQTVADDARVQVAAAAEAATAAQLKAALERAAAAEAEVAAQKRDDADHKKALQQLEEALEASRRDALDVSKLRAELAAEAARADAAIKCKERAEELLAQAESDKEEAIAAAAKAAKAAKSAAAAAAKKAELLSPAPTLPVPRTAVADGRAQPLRGSDDDDSPTAAPAPAKDGANADALLPTSQPGAAAAAPVAFARKKPRPKSNLSMLMSAGTFALPPPSQSAPPAAPAPSQQLPKAALPLVASTQHRGDKTKAVTDALPAAAAKRAKTAAPAPPAAKPTSKVRGGAGSARSTGGAMKRGDSKATAAPALLTFQQTFGKRDPTPPADDPFAFFST